MTVPTFLAGLALAVLGVAAYVLVLIRSDDNAPEYPGATVEYATELHGMTGAHAEPMTAETAPVYVSRHHDETVEIVVGEYRPARFNNPALAALLTRTDVTA